MSKLISYLPPSAIPTPPKTFADDLPNTAKTLAKKYIQTFTRHEDLVLYKEFLQKPEKWRLPLVSFDTFLDSPHYLGIGDKVYPAIRKMSRQILENKYSEAVIVGAIGAGKTFIAVLLQCYLAHKLLCMRDPYDTYNLTKDKPISVINMGTTATQAMEVAFAGMKGLIEASPWFQSFNPNILRGTIRFNDHSLLLISGNSKATTPLGYNIFSAILDEAAFYLDNNNTQTAEDIYTSLQRRIVSRFGYDGLLVMISSPKYDGDFIMKKLDEAKKFPDVVYAKQLPIWKCKPLDQLDIAHSFYFNARRGLIEENPQGTICKVSDKFDVNTEIWEIPGEYYKSFAQDPDKAMRDYAALPSKAIAAFMPHTDIIKAMFTDEESPLQPDGSYKFKERPLRTNYYMHIDLALNRNGKGDYCGLSLAHLEGWEENPVTKEKQKIVKIDLAERIGAGSTGQIEFADVRNKIYALKKMGFHIALCTFDSFNSIDMISILRSKGIRAEYVSVDRTVEPYSTFKELIYSGRVKCHKSDVLFEELRRLEITKSQKIDHPPGFGKDVADAVCGACWNVLEKSVGELGMALGVTEPPVQKTYAESLQEKTQYYQELEKMMEAGII